MRPVSIVGIGQVPAVLVDEAHDEAELVREATGEALADAAMSRADVGFVVSGSSDYVMGRPFSFTTALDGVGPWPPIRESHVEMDGAWALYEAWVRLQHGDVDTALVYAYGKGSHGPIDDVLTLQLDPYVLAPLGLDPLSLAALQARVLLDRGLANERAVAEVVARSRRDAARNPRVPAIEAVDVEALLAAPTVSSPLRAHDGPRRTDGAAAVVLRVGTGPARIAGVAHQTDAHGLGVRDLGDCPSARGAAERATRGAGLGRLDAIELHAPYAPQELVLRRALGLGDVPICPSGGALVSDTPFVTGLVRVCEAVRLLRDGADRVAAHATAGPALQQNLVAVLERA
jgi:acetyl-CoA acetyltransferase